jgi:hypothetical protein
LPLRASASAPASALAVAVVGRLRPPNPPASRGCLLMHFHRVTFRRLWRFQIFCETGKCRCFEHGVPCSRGRIFPNFSKFTAGHRFNVCIITICMRCAFFLIISISDLRRLARCLGLVPCQFTLASEAGFESVECRGGFKCFEFMFRKISGG